MANFASSVLWDRADVDRFASMIVRAQNELGKTPFDAINWAGYFVTKSMAGATKEAPKLRKIIANPHPDAKTDGRRAKYGVMRYTPDGKEYFQPIYRTGEFGKIRFQNKKTAVWLVRDKATGGVRKETWSTGTGEFDMAGINQSPKRNIKRRKLAKQAWSWAQKNTRKGGTVSIMGAQNVVNVLWGGKKSAPSLTISNNLRYASDAFKGGESGVAGVMEKAANSMANRINDTIEKAFQ